jgi:arsenate reductase (thioredoxin)
MPTTIDAARVSDSGEVLRLLEQNRLPTAGLLDHLRTTLVARDGERVVGSAALEVYADGALLRSVAVAPERQHQRLGTELTDAALRLAHELHTPAIYLLTTTAETFFPRFGFEPIARADVPATVRTSVEFTSACPDTAVVMRKIVRGPNAVPAIARVVFACVHNAGRSQMAAAFLAALADPARVEAASAGTRPGDRVHPEVVDAMREVGIDLAGKRPQLLTAEIARGASLLVTMGCGDECPFVPGLERDDWALGDPKDLPAEHVRAIRDDIRNRVAALVDSRGWRRATL